MKVAIYTRVSTDEQASDGYSLEVQQEYLRDFAKRQGWKLYLPDGNIYQDEMSGYSLERPALKQLLNDAKLKRFNLVLVYKIDRFSRKLKDLLNLVEDLEMHDVALRSATEPYDTTTSAGKLMFQQLGSFAEFERNRIAERVFPGMVKGVQKGRWQGSRYVPYGYSYDKETQMLNLVPEEAEIVKKIYSLYLSGQSTSQVAGYFYQEGVKTRSGGKFHSKLIRDILRSKLYIGKIVWNKSHYDTKIKTPKGYKYVKNDSSKVIEGDGLHQAIITKEEFDLVQKKLESNRRGRSHRKGAMEYPLTGIVFCSDCHHKFRGANNISNHRTGEKKRWYRCTARQEHHIKCANPSVLAEQLEPQLFEVLDRLMTHSSFKQKRMDNLIKGAQIKTDEELKSQMAELKSRLQQNHDVQRKFLKQYLNDAISMDILKDECIDFRAEEQQIKKQMAKLDMMMIEKERSEEYQKLLERVVSQFDQTKKKLDIVSKKELLKLIFKQILVKNKQIEKIEFHEPFGSFYKDLETENREKKCLTHCKRTTKENSYILKPTDVR